MTKTTLHEQAMSQIPGYTEADQQVQLGEKWLKEVRATLGVVSHDYASPAQSELATAAVTDGKFPEGLGRRHIEAALFAQAKNEEVRQLEIFLQTAKVRRREAIEYDGDPALKFLDGVLRDYTDEMVELAPAIRDLPDLEVIADTGNRKALALRKRRYELVERYLNIRSAQQSVIMTVMASQTDPLEQSLARRAFLTVAQVREAIKVEEYWLERRKEARSGSDKATGELQVWHSEAPAPVLAAEKWGAPLPKGDIDVQMDALLRIIEQATPWVPTVPQLQYVMEQSELATMPAWRDGDSQRILDTLESLTVATTRE